MNGTKKYLLIGDNKVLIGEFDTEKEAVDYMYNHYSPFDWECYYHHWEVVVPGEKTMFGVEDVLITEEEYEEECKNNKKYEGWPPFDENADYEGWPGDEEDIEE